MAINVRFLNTGTMTAIDDSCIESIFHHNRLQKLEELRIAKSSGLSITVAYQLIHQCPYLRSIRTLESWSSVSELVSFLKLHIKNICGVFGKPELLLLECNSL